MKKRILVISFVCTVIVFASAILLSNFLIVNDSLLNENIEALSQDEDQVVYNDMMDMPITGGVVTVTAQNTGEITILGISLKLTKSHTYVISYTVWGCVPSAGSICTPLGTVIDSITEL